MKNQGKKHPLLIYERLHRQRRWSMLIAALLFVGFFALPYFLDAETAKKLWPPDFDIVLLILAAIAFLIFMYKLVAPRLAYVQCTERNIRVQTPLYPVVISYRRVATTRPNQWGQLYPLETTKRSQRRLLEGIRGESVLILDLKGWPVSPAMLRWFMPNVMFSPSQDGLVLWVSDWMTLNREITDFVDRRRATAAGPREEASLYARMRRE